MKRLFVAALFLASGSLTACGSPGPSIPKGLSKAPQSGSASALPSISVGDGVVKVDSGQGGSEDLAINLRSPHGARFSSQSIVHRWVSSDVTEYDVTLSVGTGSGMTALATVQVYPKAAQPQTEAIFDHLRVGVPYVVTVLARGNVGGSPTDPTQILNTQTPANALILFTSFDKNDIDNAKAVAVTVQLDSVPFSGTATVSITTVDGTYSAPAEPEAASAGSAEIGTSSAVDHPSSGVPLIGRRRAP